MAQIFLLSLLFSLTLAQTPEGSLVIVEGVAQRWLEPDQATLVFVLQVSGSDLNRLSLEYRSALETFTEAVVNTGVPLLELRQQPLGFGLGERSALIEVTLALVNLEPFLTALPPIETIYLLQTVFSASDERAILELLREEALADARARADTYARLGGLIVGNATQVRELPLEVPDHSPFRDQLFVPRPLMLRLEVTWRLR